LKANWNSANAGSVEAPVEPNSILVGKTYRTAADELRRVTSMEDGKVVYTAASSPGGPGMMAHLAGKKADLADFAREAENEVVPD
jgi:hypothetical protein